MMSQTYLNVVHLCVDENTNRLRSLECDHGED